MIEDAGLGESDNRSEETRAWYEVVKVFIGAYVLGFLSCLWLFWHMGLFSR